MHTQRKYYPVHFHILLVTSLYIFFIAPEGKAQYSNQVFERLTTENGLSSDKVEAVIQDHDGFYWIATQNGLNRYDGTSFKIYRHLSEDSTSLTDNYCTALQEGKNGDIWVATYKGVSRYIKSRGCFQRIFLHHPSGNFEITNRIYDIAIDTSGNVWMSGKGIWKYDVSTDAVLFCNDGPGESSSLTEKGQINHLVFDKINNGLWFSNGTDLAFFSISAHQYYYKADNPFGWKVFEYADGAELTLDYNNRLWFRDKETQSLGFFDVKYNIITYTTKKVRRGINQICADRKNRIWIFYWLGRSEIYNAESTITDTGFFASHHRRSAVSEKANALYIDNQDNHWISTDHGIAMYNEGNQYYKLYALGEKKETVYQNPLFIKSLAQVDPGILWIASDQGLYKYELLSGDYLHIKLAIPISNITTLCADGKMIWIGVHNQLFCFDTKTESIVQNIELTPGIYYIKKGEPGELWVGLWTGGLYRINTKTGTRRLFTKDAKDPASLKSNNLITGFFDNTGFWVGYNAGNGFSRYATTSDVFTHFHPQQNDLENSNAGTITVITKVADDQFWLGTHGSGIFAFEPSSCLYVNYEQHQGLSSNFINSIIPDTGGNLWISTADGLNYMDIKNHSIRKLEPNLVFPDNDFISNGLAGSEGKLFFFCKNEFIEIDPAAFHIDQAFPRLVISSFKIFDREESVSVDQDGIDLSYKENFFSFEYSSVKTQPFKDVKYAYMLEGFDRNWNLAENQQRASYTNVPEGHYIFKVKVTNDEGRWSKPLLNITVHIRPPFWRTWWFIGLSLVVILSSVYALYRFRIRHIKKIFSMRTKISRDLHDDIGGSLSSINIYSSVAEKEVNDNPAKAKEFLQQINTNSRQVMENISDIVWAMNSDHKHEASLTNRIKNYGYELLSQKNIECKYSIDGLVERKLSKPEARRSILLFIKEAINNMTKYSGAAHAEVRVSVSGAHLLVEISDDGKGFNAEPGMYGNGLKHMKQRTEMLGGVFTIHTLPGKGTTISGRIPLTNISDR